MVCGLYMPLWAQAPVEVPDVIPPSPTSAALGKYGDVPTDLHHGTPNISIPLYEIVVDDIRVPISLSFHASGHKVGEQASWVGLGWSLNAGGVVNRSMRGKPDEDGYFGTMTEILDFEQRDLLQYLWKWHRPDNLDYLQQEYLKKLASEVTELLIKLAATNPGSAQYAQVSQEFDEKVQEYEDYRDDLATAIPLPDEYFEMKDWMYNVTIQNSDTKADIFRYNFPGGSGKFMFKADESIVQIPYQDHLITPLNLNAPCSNCIGTLGGFRIVNTEGVEYRFNQEETTEVQYPQDVPVTEPNQYESSWYLDHILSGKSGKLVSFHYSTVQPEYADRLFSQSITEVVHGPSVESTNLNPVETVLINRVRYLTSVTWEGGTVEFITAPGRFDRVDGAGNILKEVIIKDKGDNIIKSYVLEYNNGDTNIHTTSANYLDNHLQLTSVTEKNRDGDLMPPYEISYFPNVPSRDSKARDHDGFYNGIENNPHLVADYINVNGVHVTGADRSPYALLSRAGMVQQLKYPTGGHTKFDYENHDINSSGLNYETNSSVIFVEKCDVDDILFPDLGIIGLECIDTKTEYITIPADAVNSKIFINSSYGITNPSINDPNDFYVRIYDSSNTLIFSQSSFENTVNSDILPVDETYRIELHSNIEYTKISFRLEFDIPVAGPNTIMFGGLRIAAITDYAKDSNGIIRQVKKKEYEYVNRLLGGVSSGMPLTRISPDYTNEVYKYIDWQTGLYLYRTHSSSVSSFELFGGGQVVYLEVREKEVGNGFTDYIYSNQRDDSDVILMELPFGQSSVISGYPQSMSLSSSAWKRGHLLEQKVYNESEELKSWLQNDYSYVLIDSTKSFSYETVYDDLPPSQIFSWSIDRQNSGWARLNSTTTRTYEDGIENTMTVTNIYDSDSSFILPTGREHVLDGPNNYSETFLYLNDRINHIISPVTQISRYDDQDLLLSEDVYTYINGKVQSIEKYIGNSTAPNYTTTLSEYNGLKPSYVEDPSGVDMVYLWAYDETLPVARISNATYTEITTALGTDLTVLESSFDNAWIKARLLSLQGSLSSLQNMTIYLHQQGVGLTETIDENGRSTYYIYDSFNRLLHVKDHEGNYLQQYEYNYEND